MPKMPKIEVFYRFYKEKKYVCNYSHLLISYFSCCKFQTFIIKTERSDTIILGILGILGTLDNLGIPPVYPDQALPLRNFQSSPK
jgi:hypothetical protein